MIFQYTAYLTLCTILFVTCEKYEDLTGKVEFIKPVFFGVCFSGMPAGLDTEIVITDSESYFEYFNQKRIYPYNSGCDTAELPAIDFNTYSLIGKYTEGGGCDVNFQREIIDYIREKKIVYTIKVEYTGNCYMLITCMNWALIPSLKDDYVVEFYCAEINPGYSPKR